MSVPELQAAPQITIDPDFADSSLDIVLISSDNVGFRIHSYVLKTTSSVFADMLSLPRSNEESGNIHLTETSAELRPLMLFVASKGIPTDLDGFESVLILADKYDMKGVASTVQQVISASIAKFKDPNPFRLYAIACRFDILLVKKEVFRQLLDVDIQSEPYQEWSERLDPVDLAQLLAKRRSLRRAVDKRLSNLLVADDNHLDQWMFSCPVHPHDRSSLPNYLVGFLTGLRAAVYRELDQRPSGIGIVKPGFIEPHFIDTPPDTFIFCATFHPSGEIMSKTSQDILGEVHTYLHTLINAMELEMR